MLRMGRQGSACKGSYDLCGVQWHQGPALRSTIAEMKPRTHHRTLQVTEMRLGNGNGTFSVKAAQRLVRLFYLNFERPVQEQRLRRLKWKGLYRRRGIQQDEHIRTHVRTHIHTCMHMYMYVCIHVYMYIYIYTCMFICFNVYLYKGSGSNLGICFLFWYVFFFFFAWVGLLECYFP